MQSSVISNNLQIKKLGLVPPPTLLAGLCGTCYCPLLGPQKPLGGRCESGCVLQEGTPESLMEGWMMRKGYWWGGGGNSECNSGNS